MGKQRTAILRILDKMNIILAKAGRTGLIDKCKTGYEIEITFFKGNRLIRIRQVTYTVVNQVKAVKRTDYIFVIPAFVQNNTIDVQ
jgi:hypothetical protein